MTVLSRSAARADMSRVGVLPINPLLNTAPNILPQQRAEIRKRKASSVAVQSVQQAEIDLRAALAHMDLCEGQGSLADMDARTDAVADARRSLAAAKDHCQF
jgi:hypothetical protein